jgi:hypothetical protein
VQWPKHRLMLWWGEIPKTRVKSAKTQPDVICGSALPRNIEVCNVSPMVEHVCQRYEHLHPQLRFRGSSCGKRAAVDHLKLWDKAVREEIETPPASEATNGRRWRQLWRNFACASVWKDRATSRKVIIRPLHYPYCPMIVPSSSDDARSATAVDTIHVK